MMKVTNRFGRSIKTNTDEAFYSDEDKLFFAYNEFGPFMAILAPEWTVAYGVLIDSMDPVPQDELYEAYGFDSQEEFTTAIINEPGLMGLSEGYAHQDNSTGTGIVNVGYYLTLQQIKWDGWGQRTLVVSGFQSGLHEWTVQFQCSECEQFDCRCSEVIAKTELTLTDDGTMDTVFECDVCNQTLRFDNMDEHRDGSGRLMASGWVEAFECHEDECEQKEVK